MMTCAAARGVQEVAAAARTSRPTRAAGPGWRRPSTTMSTTKQRLLAIASEFLVHGDTAEVAARLVAPPSAPLSDSPLTARRRPPRSLRDFRSPAAVEEFVHRAIRLSFDYGEREREMVSKLLSSLCVRRVMSRDTLLAGIRELLGRLPDITVDVPSSLEDTALMIANLHADTGIVATEFFDLLYPDMRARVRAMLGTTLPFESLKQVAVPY